VIAPDVAALVRVHVGSVTMVSELHPTVIQCGESVPSAAGDVCCERREVGPAEVIGVRDTEMKYGLCYRLQRRSQPGHQLRCPRAGADQHTVRDDVTLARAYAPNPRTVLYEAGARRGPDLCSGLDGQAEQVCHHGTALGPSSSGTEVPVRVFGGIPGRTAPSELFCIDPLRCVAAFEEDPMTLVFETTRSHWPGRQD